MKFKVLGGKIKDESLFLKEKHRQKEGNDLMSVTLMFGNLSLEYQSKWGGVNNHAISAEIETAEIVTDENKVNFAGAVGWGAVGGLLTGGVGLLAGALLGGRGKASVCAIRFSDGTQLLVQGKTKDVAKLMFL